MGILSQTYKNMKREIKKWLSGNFSSHSGGIVTASSYSLCKIPEKPEGSLINCVYKQGVLHFMTIQHK